MISVERGKTWHQLLKQEMHALGWNRSVVFKKLKDVDATITYNRVVDIIKNKREPALSEILLFHYVGLVDMVVVLANSPYHNRYIKGKELINE